MKSNKYNIDKNIKQDVLSEEERKEIIVPAQKTLEQKKDSTWDNAVINGIHVNYKLVAPKDNNLSNKRSVTWKKNLTKTTKSESK